MIVSKDLDRCSPIGRAAWRASDAGHEATSTDQAMQRTAGRADFYVQSFPHQTRNHTRLIYCLVRHMGRLILIGCIATLAACASGPSEVPSGSGFPRHAE